jgi:hypothetical protein
MNKKTMIELVIVVVAFGASGLVLYNGIFSGNNNSALQPANSNSTSSQEDILPYGSGLNFDDAIKPSQFIYNKMQYPQVDKSEIGIPPQNLVLPLPVVVPASSGTSK